jgi:hypothetical protein
MSGKKTKKGKPSHHGAENNGVTLSAKRRRTIRKKILDSLDEDRNAERQNILSLLALCTESNGQIVPESSQEKYVVGSLCRLEDPDNGVFGLWRVEQKLLSKGGEMIIFSQDIGRFGKKTVAYTTHVLACLEREAAERKLTQRKKGEKQKEGEESA